MASSSNSRTKDSLRDLLKGISPDDLLQFFAQKSKIDTTEEMIPALRVRNIDAESVVPKLQPVVTEDASRKPEAHKDITSLDAHTGASPQTASDLLSPYAGMSILYLTRRLPSTYVPSSLMMYHLVHIMNDILTDSRSFRRACPDYHPYILRLYCGILFWIQCLRVCAHTATLSGSWHQFLVRFLDTHPLESLPIPAPLVLLFKSLCASQPEIKEYGFVSPTLPPQAGPSRRDSFMRDEPAAFVLPNVPGIFALLADLNAKINATQPIYPTKYAHTPVSDAAVTFGLHQFAADADRTAKDKWSLVSAGLEYPCEADKKLHETFAERFPTFNFPPMAAGDNLTRVDHFLNMGGRTDWFGRVKDVAAAVSGAFKGSGTLADCAVSGLNANQYVIEYSSTSTALPAPTQVADPLSIFPFSIKARTSVRTFSQLTLSHACLVQTNILAPPNHPYINTFGQEEVTRHGHFWQIQPSESSETNEEGYIALRTLVKGLFDLKH